jgi:hypothetical protein
MGKNINKQKTKYMITPGNRTIFDAKQTIGFGDKNLKVVNEFVYLGGLANPKNDVGLEVQRRIQNANNRCMCSLQKHLLSSHLARQTKLTIYKTLIRPVLLFGSKTWVVQKG